MYGNFIERLKDYFITKFCCLLKKRFVPRFQLFTSRRRLFCTKRNTKNGRNQIQRLLKKNEENQTPERTLKRAKMMEKQFNLLETFNYSRYLYIIHFIHNI